MAKISARGAHKVASATVPRPGGGSTVYVLRSDGAVLRKFKLADGHATGYSIITKLNAKVVAEMTADRWDTIVARLYGPRKAAS